MSELITKKISHPESLPVDIPSGVKTLGVITEEILSPTNAPVRVPSGFVLGTKTIADLQVPVGKKQATVEVEGKRYALLELNVDGDILDKDGNVLKFTPPFEPVVGNGVAKITIEGADYGMLLLDSNGDFNANVSLRSGLLADLVTLAGNPNEVAVATDATALVLFNGVIGEARVLKIIDNPTQALGLNSLALGGAAATTAIAEKAVSVGYTANAGQYGAVTLGGAIPKIQTVHATLGGTTTDASGIALSLDGVAENAVNLKLPAGFHDVDVVFFARQGPNWARFHRRVMFRASASSLGVLSNETTPTPDVASGLVGLSVNFSQFNAGRLYFNAVGLAATTIYWSAHVTVRSHGI